MTYLHLFGYIPSLNIEYAQKKRGTICYIALAGCLA